LKLKLVSDIGKGRAFLVVREENSYAEFAKKVSDELSRRTRVVVLESPIVRDTNWGELSGQLLAQLKELSIRQASFVGFGAACSLIQNVCLQDIKLVRTAVFVDAASRAHPSALARFIDRVERALPLGLPLRLKNQGFDAKPYLQRMRCPALVVTTETASPHIRNEAELLEAMLPTSWRLDISTSDAVDKLAEQILNFQEVPARCPQKNLAAGRG
jgi:hypothetical protein